MENHFGEKWKNVSFDFEYANDYRIEVSNLGKVRTFNKISNGNILKGSMINGYRIIRLKFFKERDSETKIKLEYLQSQVTKLAKKIKAMHENNESEIAIAEATDLLKGLKKNVSKKFAADVKKRTMHYHSLVHRLVAEYFITKPSDGHTVVAHLDYNKLNNGVNNLKWMTPAENYEHQKNSPLVIQEREERRHRRKENLRVTKLTVTKVMLLKKLLNQGKPMKQLVKQFKVTDTQIFRIKRGENWSDIEAAK